MKILVKIDNQSFEVEVADLNARPVLAVVDGETFEVWPEEAAPAGPAAPVLSAPQPQPRTAPAPAAAAPCEAPVNKDMAVPAPIPGVINSIAVKPGDVVKKGQELCVLEAMKMKNIIRAGRDGSISAVRINVGDQVKHGQILMEFAD